MAKISIGGVNDAIIAFVRSKLTNQEWAQVTVTKTDGGPMFSAPSAIMEKITAAMEKRGSR